MGDLGNQMNGKVLANQIQEGLKKRIEEEGLTPGLAGILVGARKDSLSYVQSLEFPPLIASFPKMLIKRY